MSNVNNKQVGGSHYRSALQHWDFVELNGLGYLEGCATKYATRGRKKHLYNPAFRFLAACFGVKLATPIEDLEKAIHYVEKAQALFLAGYKRPRVITRLVISVEDFAAANGLTEAETSVVRILTFWQDAADLQDAIEQIEGMIGEARN